jgi:FkbM family methyltransferase
MKNLIRNLLPPFVRRILKPMVVIPLSILLQLLNKALLWFDGILVNNIVTDEWKAYWNNTDLFEQDFEKPVGELITELKINLDSESRIAIDSYAQRCLFATLASKMNLCPTNSQWYKIYSDAELDNLKKAKLSRKKSPLISLDRINTYYTGADGGLAFVPNEITDRLVGKDVIDGGAYIGDSIFHFLKYGVSRVFAFEPSEQNYHFLITNCNRMNWNRKVIPVHKGLVGKQLPIRKERVKRGNEGSGFCLTHDVIKEQKFEVIDIDSFVEKNNLNIGLIKLDIEGLEYDVIQGSIKTIQQFRPVMLISIYHTPKDFFCIKPFIEQLNLNYNFKIRRIDPWSPYAETILICYPE